MKEYVKLITFSGTIEVGGKGRIYRGDLLADQLAKHLAEEAQRFIDSHTSVNSTAEFTTVNASYSRQFGPTSEYEVNLRPKPKSVRRKKKDADVLSLVPQTG